MNGHRHIDDGVPDDGVSDDALDDDALDDDALRDRLRLLLGPSDGLDQRTARDVDSALRAQSPLATAFELFGVGWWTVETLFSDRSAPGADGTLTGRPDGADRDVEGP